MNRAGVEIGIGRYLENARIDRDLEIIGNALESPILDGGAMGPVIEISSQASVVLENVSITNGTASRGGGILNHGSLVVRNARIENNIADGSNPRGGGIFSDGELRVFGSTISGNEASCLGMTAGGVARGAGIDVEAGMLELTSTEVVDNRIACTTVPGVVASGAGLATNVAATLTDATIARNEITVDARPAAATISGAGVWSSESVSLSGCTIAENSLSASGIDAAARGAGMHVDATIASASTIRDNRVLLVLDLPVNDVLIGAGIYVVGHSAPTTFVDSTISGNVVSITTGAEGFAASGGGALVRGVRDVSVLRTRVVNNEMHSIGAENSVVGVGFLWKPEGGASSGNLSVVDSTFSGNLGEAYYALGIGLSASPMAGASARVVGTTISANEARSIDGAIGAGLSIGSSEQAYVDIVNSTLWGNIASSTTGALGSAVGQALAVSGSVSVESSTIGGSPGSAPSLYLSVNARLNVTHSIVAGRCSLQPSALMFTAISMFTTNSGCSTTANDIVSDSQGLGLLSDNGGSTQTVPLQPTSPAVDAADVTGCKDANGVVLTTDQRGMPRIVNNRCDLGAYER